MAQANYKFKMGSVEAELITGAAVSNSETSISHTLGAVPDAVFVTPVVNAAVYQSSLPTSTVVKLTGSASTSTCNILLIRSTTKTQTV